MESSVHYPYIYFTIDTPVSIHEFLDTFHLSRKTIHLLKQNKEVLLNDQYCALETMMQPGDTLKVLAYSKDDGMYPPTYGELDICYEDDYLLIVNKPPFINVYPDHPDKKDALSNIVSYYYRKHHLDIPVRYIHRLDYETSGLVMFVKCSFVQPLLDYQLSVKEIHRKYLALVEGSIPVHTTKLIKAPISIDRHHSSKMRVGRNGKEAKTYFKCIASNNEYALVECNLLTGRKHQIRVHLSYMHHPLLGDLLYGNKSSLINRQALHAYQLSFIHPTTKKAMNITCSLPGDFMEVLTAVHLDKYKF